MCKSLNLMEQEFQTQLMKHAGALLTLMNKLQDMVHCSLDLREVIEKAAADSPDILYSEKVSTVTVKKPAAENQTTTPVKQKTEERASGSHFGMEFPSPQTTPAKKPAAKDALPPAKKKLKLNTDCLANDII